MSKSKHRKWYDREEEYDSEMKAEEFRERRAKRLRIITDKHEELESDGEE